MLWGQPRQKLPLQLEWKQEEVLYLQPLPLAGSVQPWVLFLPRVLGWLLPPLLVLLVLLLLLLLLLLLRLLPRILLLLRLLLSWRLLLLWLLPRILGLLSRLSLWCWWCLLSLPGILRLLGLLLLLWLLGLLLLPGVLGLRRGWRCRGCLGCLGCLECLGSLRLCCLHPRGNCLGSIEDWWRCRLLSRHLDPRPDDGRPCHWGSRSTTWRCDWRRGSRG
mmetsp:Transcript_39525/g.84358  ORF Transcript_39525/g.84358 Transcript_39525/m.84358 type:complete len:219 (-) Transcript_39525:1789-2445(-)